MHLPSTALASTPATARIPPPDMLADKKPTKYGKKRGTMARPYENWARPCSLDNDQLIQGILPYDQTTFNFAGIARAILGAANLEDLHHQPILDPDETPPQMRRAQIQARVGLPVSTPERKNARNHAKRYENTDEYRQFLSTYQSFIHEWVVPQLGNVALLYQRKPILRVVLPGSVAPTAMHCDADYFHDSNEINYWVPLTPVWGSNSLWVESAPGAGDFAPFVAGAGEAVRFYGNRCRHYTLPNDSGGVRVSFDFRVTPLHLFEPPTELALTLSRHTLNPGMSKKGYYEIAYPKGQEESALALAARREAWREAHRESVAAAAKESEGAEVAIVAAS